MAKKARLVDDNYASVDYIDYPSRKRNSFPAMTDDEIKHFYDCLLKEDDMNGVMSILRIIESQLINLYYILKDLEYMKKILRQLNQLELYQDLIC